MQIHKITVSQAIELFKKKDLWAKIALTVLFLSYLSFCRACFFNPIAGEDFPIYENNYPGDLYGFRAKNKGAKQCELDGKKIFLERENQNESFWYDFFIDINAPFVWHLQYQDDDNTRKNMHEAIKKTMFEDALASKVKLICKKREEIIDEFEKGFEGDDFLKLDKLESTFNFFLINVYHKFITQIIEESVND